MARRARLQNGCLCALAGILSVFPGSGQAFFVNTYLGGSLGYGYRDSSYSTGVKEQQHVMNLDLRNRFYLMEDWLISGESQLRLSEDLTTTHNGERERSTVTGSLGLNFLPQSHFPLRIAYRRSDSSLSYDVPMLGSELAPGDRVVTETTTLNQSYIGQGYRLNFNHVRNRQESTLRGDFGSDITSVDGVWRFSEQDVQARYLHKEENLYLQGERKAQSASLLHNLTRHPQWNVSTMASSSRTEQQLQENGRVYAIGTDQASSNLSWRSIDRMTSVNGGVRYHALDFGMDEVQREVISLSGTLGMLHRFNQNLTANANISRFRSQEEHSDQEGRNDQDRLGLNYRSDRLELGRYTYNWYAGTEAVQRRSEALRETTGTVSLGHDLYRDWVLSRASRINFRAGQDWSASKTRGEEESGTTEPRIGHRLMLGWSQSTAGGSRQLQFSFNERRDLHEENLMRIYGADYQQQHAVTRRMSLNGNLNYQQTDYEYGQTQTDTSTTSLNASLNFNYLQPFSVPGLGFNSELRYVDIRTAGEGDISNDRMWNNRLNYRVGKLESSLQYMMRETRQTDYRVIYFNIKRNF